jgi:hypothetical protein
LELLPARIGTEPGLKMSECAKEERRGKERRGEERRGERERVIE